MNVWGKSPDIMTLQRANDNRSLAIFSNRADYVLTLVSCSVFFTY